MPLLHALPMQFKIVQKKSAKMKNGYSAGQDKWVVAMLMKACLAIEMLMGLGCVGMRP
jgi:hypothetical protein